MKKTAITRKEQKEATRNGLILTATKMFAKEGIVGTSTADIAKEQNVSHGTVFVHFSTREDLILAVIDNFGEKLSQKFGSCAELVDLRALLEFHLEVLTEYENFYYRLISESSYLPTQVKSTVFMLNAAISWKLYKSYEPHMKAGEFKQITQPLLFNTWMALIHYYLINRDLLSNKTSILKEKKEELIEHFINLIQTKENKNERKM